MVLFNMLILLFHTWISFIEKMVFAGFKGILFLLTYIELYFINFNSLFLQICIFCLSTPILIKFILYFYPIQFFKHLRIKWFTRYSNHLRDILSIDIFIYPGDWIAINYSWGSKILQVHNRYCTNISTWFFDVSDPFKCLKITNDEKWNPNLLLNW